MSEAPIPVVLLDHSGVEPLPGTVLVRLAPPRHAHDGEPLCPACAAEGDVRVVLFNLLEEVQQGLRPPLRGVSIDTSALPSPQPIADALTPGRVPAGALRDHIVARRFVLSQLKN